MPFSVANTEKYLPKLQFNRPALFLLWHIQPSRASPSLSFATTSAKKMLPESHHPPKTSLLGHCREYVRHMISAQNREMTKAVLVLEQQQNMVLFESMDYRCRSVLCYLRTNTVFLGSMLVLACILGWLTHSVWCGETSYYIFNWW